MARHSERHRVRESANPPFRYAVSHVDVEAHMRRTHSVYTMINEVRTHTCLRQDPDHCAISSLPDYLSLHSLNHSKLVVEIIFSEEVASRSCLPVEGHPPNEGFLPHLTLMASRPSNDMNMLSPHAEIIQTLSRIHTRTCALHSVCASAITSGQRSALPTQPACLPREA